MSPAKQPGVTIIVFAFALAWIVIGLTTVYGVPTNSLHTSAQAWAFGVVIAVLVAFGLPSVVNWSVTK
jgi:hypothetical protein